MRSTTELRQHSGLVHDPIDRKQINRRIMPYLNNLDHRTLIKLDPFEQMMLQPERGL